MKKIVIFSIALLSIGSLFLLSASSAFATHCDGHFLSDPTLPPCATGSLGPGDGTGAPELKPSPGNQPFPNPLGTTEYVVVIGNVVKTVLGVVGVLALVIFIYGGIVWMTSLGNSERVKQGRDTLVWASLGLIVIFASFAIVNLLLSAFKP